jgi:3-dehydrosphinganine reductase
VGLLKGCVLNSRETHRRFRIANNMGLCASIGKLLFLLLVALGLAAYYFGPSKLELQGAHVVITGGSSGIGLAVAKEVLGRGARVSIIARNPQRLEDAKKVLSRTSEAAQIFTVSADVTQHEAASQAVADAEAKFGPVDVLITSAGVTRPGVFEELPVEEFERQIRVNYLGTAYSVRAVVPGMKKRKSGRIVMVSSQAGQIGIYGYTAYSASKFALRGFAESLRMELAPHNVFVSVNYPPDTATPQLEGTPADTCIVVQCASPLLSSTVTFPCRGASYRRTGIPSCGDKPHLC